MEFTEKGNYKIVYYITRKLTANSTNRQNNYG